ncbi:plasmalemma vesicle-associated protein [Pelodytes ibericus]
MDKSYAMAKFGLESKEMLKSNHKDCWYYLKYFFLFTSIIQFLIIMGLVLFMVYGNAHAFTETRLQNVETLNNKLMGDIKAHERHIHLLTTNLTRVEKEKIMYAAFLEGKSRALNAMNATVVFQSYKIAELTALNAKQCLTPAPRCDACNDRLEKLNNSCIVDKLLAQRERDSLFLEFRFYKESCNKTIDTVRAKVTQAENDKEKYLAEANRLKNDKADHETQMEKFKVSCTTIEDKFKNELDNLKHNFEVSVRTYMPDNRWSMTSQSQIEQILQTCRPLPDQITRNIEQSLIRLRQDVISTYQENSKMQVKDQRLNEDLKKCGQEKEEILQKKNDELSAIRKASDANVMRANDEKDRLKIEKDKAERKMTESEASLSRTSLQLVGIMEELQRCNTKTPQGPGARVVNIPNFQLKKTFT